MNWIDIKDKQPEEGQEIIVAEVGIPELGESGVSICYGSASLSDGIWYCSAYRKDDYRITFWISEEDLIAALPSN